jgi:hypothetical protein
VFDETNGSQVEQYDLDIVDDEEAPCEVLQIVIPHSEIAETKPPYVCPECLIHTYLIIQSNYSLQNDP